MTDNAYAAILSRTYYHRVSAWRMGPDGEQPVCEDAKCALSRSAMVAAPAPPDSTYVLPEAAYRLSLYTLPQRTFQLGDRLEITDTAGRVFHGRSSDSIRYPSHCVTVVEIREVTEP
ncbi:MAG: hypothetical protein E7429_00285 [Ruminococcaceae bacterium]|nr:hypothetical protein [Oscillospiraceae bacterium]